MFPMCARNVCVANLTSSSVDEKLSAQIDESVSASARRADSAHSSWEVCIYIYI